MVLLYSHTDNVARVPVVEVTVPEPAIFEITVDRRGAGPRVIRVCGDVDITTAPLLDHALGQHLLTHSVVVDLFRVGFLGCAGLMVLESATRGGDPERPVIAAVAVGEVRHVLQIAGLDRVLPCCAELDQAVERVRRVAAASEITAATLRETPQRNPAPG